MLYDFLNGVTANFYHNRGFRPNITGEGDFYTIKDIDFIQYLKEGKAVITEKEAYVIGPNGVKYPVYFYKTNYYFFYNGGERGTPKFHIRKCDTITSFGDDAFSASNTKEAIIRNRNNRVGEREYSLSLSICANCVKGVTGRQARTTEAFYEELLNRNNNEQIAAQPIRVDLDGYPLDWPKISKGYRKAKKYICEKCKIGLSLDRSSLHVHHIDGVKTNCKQRNLECLCPLCHANADDHHYTKFQEDGIKEDLRRFVKKYSKELTELKNPYLRDYLAKNGL